ncbi:SAGA complex subunit Sgf73, partial [Oleoguttula sp. CCFEE 5521]
MAPNGTTSRKSMPSRASRFVYHMTDGSTAPAAPQKSGAGKPNGTTPSSLFEDLQKAPEIKSEVASTLPLVKKPGNWDDEVVANGTERSLAAPSLRGLITCPGVKKESPPPHQSLLRRPPADLIRAFPNGKPMSDTPIVLKCNHCKRTVTETGMPKHIERCLNKKQE